MAPNGVCGFCSRRPGSNIAEPPMSLRGHGSDACFALWPTFSAVDGRAREYRDSSPAVPGSFADPRSRG
jgi:hypothetical protein